MAAIVAIVAEVKELFYEYEQVEVQYESQYEVCKERGFLNELIMANVVDRESHIVKEKWVSSVYKKVGDAMIPGKSVMQGVKIQEAFFTNESAKQLIDILTMELLDYLREQED